MMINDREYITKEEAAARCKAFAAAHPGSTFHNFAHCKVVRRPTTAEEQAAERERTGGSIYHLSVDIYEWNKVYTDDEILVAHPEARGLWRERRVGIDHR